MFGRTTCYLTASEIYFETMKHQIQIIKNLLNTLQPEY